MNCNQRRYELSQCLDGRLPSGRRTLVMEHLEQCGDCLAFWTDLQAAQRLVLQLPQERVGAGFREQLWERIHAGEGTPEAVFHEPVPLATKLRYALTGAAAAAAALLAALSLRSDPEPTAAPVASAAPVAADERVPVGREMSRRDDVLPLEQHPLLASTQRLTADVVAMEAARQLEQRYATAHRALDRLQKRSSDPEIAVGQLLDNADEFHDLGELLLELQDRRRLVFVEPEVGTDLRVAVGLLGQTSLLRRNQDSVASVVGRALQSRRLGSISGMISLVPMDPREEREVLVRLNWLRPEVFPKLFFVFGTDDELRPLGIRGSAFAMEDACGTSWVAPRSLVEARDNLLLWAHARGEGAGRRVEVQIQLPPTPGKPR
ncbi:MAG: zf-HC2 domain-containing protein [Planctomycetes bacterium]|nr:zf-HC2 domain-containing protein [Planctomycetota bacterium]